MSRMYMRLIKNTVSQKPCFFVLILDEPWEEYVEKCTAFADQPNSRLRSKK